MNVKVTDVQMFGERHWGLWHRSGGPSFFNKQDEIIDTF